jgi:hypothetical protein
VARSTLAPQNVPGADPDEAPDIAPASKPLRTAPQFLDDEERLVAELRKMPPDARTRLKRVNDLTKRYETHAILAPDEVTTEWIGKRFGGGRYLVEVLERNDKRQEVVRASATWIIPGPYLGVGAGLPGINEKANANPMDPDVVARHPSNPMPTRELFDSVLATRAMEIIQQDRRPEAASKGTDLVGLAAIITAAGAILSPIVAKLLDRGPDPALERVERELRAMRAAPGPAAGALADAMKGIREVVSLRDTLDGVSGGKVSTVDRILEALPGVMDAFRGRGVAPQPAPAAPLPQLSPGAPLVSVASPGAEDRPPLQALLFNFREQVLFMANNAWEPEYAADLVQRAVPSEALGLLTEFLQRPDADAILVQTIPELGAFEKWRPAFLAECRRLLTTPEDDDGMEEAAK